METAEIRGIGGRLENAEYRLRGCDKRRWEQLMEAGRAGRRWVKCFRFSTLVHQGTTSAILCIIHYLGLQSENKYL